MSGGDNAKAEAQRLRDHKGGFLGSIFGAGRGKQEEAGELYTKAGNAFKFEKNWDQAAECFTEAAKCFIKAEGSTNDACTSFVEAANACKQASNTTGAIEAYGKAIEIYNENGRFTQSARYYKEIGELYETERNRVKAMENFEQAAGIYGGDDKKSSANDCWKKVATLAADSGDFRRAAEIFLKLAQDSLGSKLGAFSAKGYFLQAVLSHLAAGDSVAAGNVVNTGKNTDHSYPSSRECTFSEQLIEVWLGR
ncbi:unnamed protein product [Ectocarpus fasciculatus]